YEPDIEHSTCGAKPSGFVGQLQDKARDIVRGAALLSALTFGTQTIAVAAPVRDVVLGFDAAKLAVAESFLAAADADAPEFPALANAFAALINIHPQPERARAIDHSLEVKIAAPEYAARTLGNGEDAAEFVRCLKLIAGQDATALYLQQLASHYYAEARHRPVPDVLKEMGLLALELSAVTATAQQLCFDEAENDPNDQLSVEDLAPMSPADARDLWSERVAQVLGEAKTDERIYADELRAQRRLVYRKGASGSAYDEFDQQLSDMSASTVDDEEFGTFLDSFERAYEQFDEGFAVSLHMTDGERKIACGDLDDDVDADCLPKAARHLTDELHRLYTNGFPIHDRGESDGVEGVLVSTFVRDREAGERVPVPTFAYGIDAWLEARLDEIFGSRTTRTSRRLISVPDKKRPARNVERERILPREVEREVVRHGETVRFKEIRHSVMRERVAVPSSRLHEQTERIEVCPDAEERNEARTVLEVLGQKLRRDYHARGLNGCAIYRELAARLARTVDTAVVARLKREAWQYREGGRLSFKMFTAFNTHAVARQAELEAAPSREMRPRRVVKGCGFTVTQTFTDGTHPFVVVQPLLNRISTLTGKTLGDFSRELHALPRQERERVRNAFRIRNSHLYTRVRDGLGVEISRASQGRLRYFRWAFYAGNKPEHPVHTLTREDQASAWEMLKSRSTSGVTPSLPFVEAHGENTATATAPAA
ncbi:MAG: hypothetical protein M3R15_17575, partial [Acidobacteriota bacterium]|nr:hypothetical protein [Acidobacteriota bacterium]